MVILWLPLWLYGYNIMYTHSPYMHIMCITSGAVKGANACDYGTTHGNGVPTREFFNFDMIALLSIHSYQWRVQESVRRGAGVAKILMVFFLLFNFSTRGGPSSENSRENDISD